MNKEHYYTGLNFRKSIQTRNMGYFVRISVDRYGFQIQREPPFLKTIEQNVIHYPATYIHLRINLKTKSVLLINYFLTSAFLYDSSLGIYM